MILDNVNTPRKILLKQPMKILVLYRIFHKLHAKAPLSFNETHPSSFLSRSFRVLISLEREFWFSLVKSSGASALYVLLTIPFRANLGTALADYPHSASLLQMVAQLCLVSNFFFALHLQLSIVRRSALPEVSLPWKISLLLTNRISVSISFASVFCSKLLNPPSLQNFSPCIAQIVYGRALFPFSSWRP